MRRRTRLLLRFAAGVGMALLVLWYADIGTVGDRLGGVAAGGALLVVALHVGDRLLMAIKWRRLLRARDLPMGLGEAVRAYFVSSFAGVFLPMTVGADAVRVAALRRSRIAAGDVVASIALERAIGAISQGLWCLLGLLLIVALRLRIDVSTSVVGLSVTAMLVGLAAAMPLSFGIARALARRWADQGGALGTLGTLAGQYAAWRDHPGELWLFLALTVLEGAFPIVTYAAAASALGVSASVVEMAAVIPIVYLVARLPFFPSAIGTEQTLFLGAGSLLGLSAGEAAAISFLVSPITLLVALLPGAIAYVTDRG